MAEMEKKEHLDACFGKAAVLEKLIDYASDSVVSKTLLDKPVGRRNVFIADKLSEPAIHKI